MTIFFEVKWTELEQIWAEHRPIIGSSEVQIKFRYAAAFRNDTKATAVEIRHQISEFYTLVKLC